MNTNHVSLSVHRLGCCSLTTKEIAALIPGLQHCIHLQSLGCVTLYVYPCVRVCVAMTVS